MFQNVCREVRSTDALEIPKSKIAIAMNSTFVLIATGCRAEEKSR